MEVINDRCAGLDVGKDEVVACIRVPDDAGGRHQELRTFPTFSSGLESLATWLQDHDVTQVVMGATGQYWRPFVRHEAPRIRAEVKGLRLWPVAAGR